MFEKLSELHKKCFPDKPWSADNFRDLKKSGCEIIMSENGFIVWKVVADKAEIITMGVTPEMRRNGIASAMIGIIEKDIKNQGVNKIFLEFSTINIPTQKLCENNGYKIAKKHQKCDSNDTNILMYKKL